MISKDRLETIRETDTHVFFWKGYLSQWYMRDFRIKGVVYNCCEQYMMSEKARLFKDEDALKIIMSSDSPATQKRAGRQVKNYVDPAWKLVSRHVVFAANMAKFMQNSDLREKLLATGTKTLVEASPYDALWGIALGPWDDAILDESNWKGENWLGKELRTVREQCRSWL
jgi:ribA/ribD-fused uncharacterized protein